MPTIFLHKHLKEWYKEVSKDPHIGFIDLEKSYDRLFEEFMWWFFKGKKELLLCILSWLRVRLDRTYFAETKNWKLKTL